MPIKLNGATSGSVELDVPAAVGSDLQLTLPATAGTALVAPGSTSITVPSVNGTLDRLERAGNILQVLTYNYTNSSVVTTTSTSYVNTGFGTWSITPSNAGSKFILEINGHHPHVNVDASNYGGGYKFYRSVAGGAYSAVTTGHNEAYFQNGVTSGHWWDFNGYGRTWDDPSYTLGQTVTYQYWFRKSGLGSAAFYAHHSATTSHVDQFTGTVTIMEIAQ